MPEVYWLAQRTWILKLNSMRCLIFCFYNSSAWRRAHPDAPIPSESSGSRRYSSGYPRRERERDRSRWVDPTAWNGDAPNRGYWWCISSCFRNLWYHWDISLLFPAFIPMYMYLCFAMFNSRDGGFTVFPIFSYIGLIMYLLTCLLNPIRSTVSVIWTNKCRRQLISKPRLITNFLDYDYAKIFASYSMIAFDQESYPEHTERNFTFLKESNWELRPRY